MDTANELRRTQTAIQGLDLWDLPVHGDERGWFKENWQREKMVALGLADFEPVQNNMSFNDEPGTVRGIHAEPWDKWVSVASGRVFGAWVDLREGPGFGTVVTAEIHPGVAVFVPKGVGNGFQTLVPGTAYSYLVNEHWSPSATYTFLNLADETVAIPWPIALADSTLSDKDRQHPRLDAVVPFPRPRTLVVGAHGQLGRALREALGSHQRAGSADAAFFDTEFVDTEHLDLTDAAAVQAWPWHEYDTVINAAAFTAVDAAEQPEGRRAAWAVNAAGPAALAQAAARHRLTLVHVSTDYVFDGTSERPYTEDDAFAPLSVYGQSKAAGDLAVRAAKRHYVLRTSWVVGDGANFVRTMARLADQGVNPKVVSDQIGRLTFATDLARAILHVLTSRAPYGTYNVTGSGEPASWADVARAVFSERGHDPARVTDITTAEYDEGKTGIAPRPAWSVLDLTAIEATGFSPTPWRVGLSAYLGEG